MTIIIRFSSTPQIVQGWVNVACPAPPLPNHNNHYLKLGRHTLTTLVIVQTWCCLLTWKDARLLFRSHINIQNRNNKQKMPPIDLIMNKAYSLVIRLCDSCPFVYITLCFFLSKSLFKPHVACKRGKILCGSQFFDEKFTFKYKMESTNNTFVF